MLSGSRTPAHPRACSFAGLYARPEALAPLWRLFLRAGQRTGYMSMTAPPSLLGCGLCGDAQEDAERLFFSFVAEAIFGSRVRAG